MEEAYSSEIINFNGIASTLKKFATAFKRWDSDFRLILLSILIGLMGGLGAYIFRVLIEQVHRGFFSLQNLNFPREIIVLGSPLFGGLVVGYIISRYSAESKGHGVPQVIKAVNLDNGKIRKRVPFIKLLTSSISIGSGGSAGREGPIAQVGGGFASFIGEILNLNNEEKKDLVISGLSAGISASFNAPLGGILFGLEIIRKDKRSPKIMPLIAASVVGTAVGIILIGDHPSFIFPGNLHDSISSNIPLYMITGSIIGILSAIWIAIFYQFEVIFSKIRLSPTKTAGLGGFLVGLIELVTPEVSGIEEGSTAAINSTFAGKVSLELAILFFIFKMLATSITLTSGGSGGLFAPTLFLGVMIGNGIGLIFNNVGFITINVAMIAVLGMAAMFAGSMRAPMTAIVMTSEMVHDFEIIIPLMFTVVTAWLVSKFVYNYDIYTIGFTKSGINFNIPLDHLDEISCREIMTKEPISVSPKDRLEHVIHLMNITGHTGYPVVQDERLVGIITEHDVTNALEIHDMKTWSVGDTCTKKLITTFEDVPASKILNMMENKQINRLPVVEKHTDRLVGWITRSDIIRCYLKQRQFSLTQKYEEEIFAIYESRQDFE